MEKGVLLPLSNNTARMVGKNPSV